MTPIAQRILSTFDELGRVSLDLHTLFEFVGGNAPENRTAVLDAVSEMVNSGLLRDDGSDFYSRTEDGRLVVAKPGEITLYTRVGCHLCDDAKAAITPLLSQFRAQLREVDIDCDPALRERYTNDVPVVFVGPRFFARHRVDPAALRRELERAS